jgi:3',5'-cyclic AMP phosphodiesterase CpdA
LFETGLPLVIIHTEHPIAIKIISRCHDKINFFPVSRQDQDTTPFIKSYYKERYRENLLGQDPEVQLAWLEKTLAASTSKWKIVIGHHPIYWEGLTSVV